MRLVLAHIVLFLFLVLTARAQDEPVYPRLETGGYIKQLQGLYFLDQPEVRLSVSGGTVALDTIENPLLTDQFIHHRLNVRLHLQPGLRVHGALRTRLFYGEVVKLSPSFASEIDDVDNDIMDMSFIWLRHSSVVGHTVADRLYLEWVFGDWEVRAGRQRINWGVSTVWNPNDVFNAYAYTDFDYEERPGSDALRVTRYFGFGHSLEVAIKASTRPDRATAALLYRFRQGNADMQVLAGFMENYWTIGGARAGSIGQAGWKIESSAFIPRLPDGAASLAASMEFDYTIEGGWYLQGGILVNTAVTADRRIVELFDFDLSARNLYPFPVTMLVRANWPVSPIFTTGLALLYSPASSHPVFLAPVATLSVAQDWDLDFFGQVVFEENADSRWTSPLQALFIRVKWSY